MSVPQTCDSLFQAALRSRVRRLGQSLAIPPIEITHATQPCQGPGLQLRPTLAHTHKVAADMRPAEHQDQGAVLHLEHGFRGALAIDHEHAAGLGWVMILRHRMTRDSSRTYTTVSSLLKTPSHQPQPTLACCSTKTS
jgi:hypothetical protein